ncbi:hypothetical protein ACGF1Z_23145 [Streptomyces sp. NPDC048018]|uniref:hypothetical protein n=1 Tax=Streptomyces sp. NPDC048018 TaxID=3365499 RepID=UPI0037102DA6
MSRTHRATAVFAALAGLVLGLLVCGTATTPAAAGPGTVASAPAGGPGCDRGHGDVEGAAAPAVPPRPHGFGELLPALAGKRTPCPGWGADQDAADAPQGPAPPEPVSPTPVELSVLRV